MHLGTSIGDLGVWAMLGIVVWFLSINPAGRFPREGEGASAYLRRTM